uniref:Glycerate kinase n=1 Tax=Glossina morsitans morsitans TaxID=37546 RepID=D3TQA8_GLOMM
MNGSKIHLQNLKQIFLEAVKAVRPSNLLSVKNNYNFQPTQIGEHLCIKVDGKLWNIENKRCHVVGFGKAVLGMAVHLEKTLYQHLVSGILSIPKGAREQCQSQADMQLSSDTVFRVYEGAEHNQPDETALQAALEIKHLATSLGQDDILFVLISGGGSALLPMPRRPLDLKKKMSLILELSNRGASIQELNIVRIALSDIKGGRLALAASRAHAVISLIISDIVGDSTELIASGPTWSKAISKHPKPKEILRRYSLWDSLGKDLRKMLTETPVFISQEMENNHIHIIGDNRVATVAAKIEAIIFNYTPCVISTSVQGNLDIVVEQYCDILKGLYQFNANIITEAEFKKIFPYGKDHFRKLLITLKVSGARGKPLLLIAGAEPTVKVKGRGLGGRNQELSLRLSKIFFEDPQLKNIFFLSAGTDGIDGPTDAAGALGCHHVIQDFLDQNNNDLEKLQTYLEENDSYNFYKNLNNGEYQIITGHTGTNVMDLHFLLLSDFGF